MAVVLRGVHTHTHKYIVFGFNLIRNKLQIAETLERGASSAGALFWNLLENNFHICFSEQGRFAVTAAAKGRRQMQPSPIVIVFVSKKPTLSLLVWVLLCSVQRSVLFFFIMYVEQALDLRILVTRTYINTHTHTATMTPILAGSISLALALPTTDTLKRTSFVFVVVHEVHH